MSPKKSGLTGSLSASSQTAYGQRIHTAQPGAAPDGPLRGPLVSANPVGHTRATLADSRTAQLQVAARRGDALAGSQSSSSKRSRCRPRARGGWFTRPLCSGVRRAARQPRIAQAGRAGIVGRCWRWFPTRRACSFGAAVGRGWRSQRPERLGAFASVVLWRNARSLASVANQALHRTPLARRR